MVKQYVFEMVQAFNLKYINSGLISLAKRIYSSGLNLAENKMPVDRLYPSYNNIEVSGSKPKFSQFSFIGPNSSICGDVTVDKNSNVFYSNLIHSGKGSSISIGRDCIIQDLNIIKSTENFNTIIRDKVIIGSNCSLENNVIGEGAVIGNGAKLGKNVEIGENSIIGIGSVLKPGTKVPANEIWVGSPARFLRENTAVEKDFRDEVFYQTNKVVEILAEEYQKCGVQVKFDLGVLNHDDVLKTTNDEFEDRKEVDPTLPLSDRDKESVTERFKYYEQLRNINQYRRQNAGNLDEYPDEERENMPDHLNIYKKNYKFEEEVAADVLSDEKSRPDQSIYDENSDVQSKNPGYKRKF